MLAVITVLVDLVLKLFSDRTSLHTMGEEKKLLYILVEDEECEEELGQNGDNKMQTHRYTRPMLQSTLQLMGCKPRHAFKVSSFVANFVIFRTELAAFFAMASNFAAAEKFMDLNILFTILNCVRPT
jgi:hypothetical protein